MDTDTDFRDILRNEGRFSPSDTLIDRLLENSDEISLKSGKVLIGYGQTDTNIYIVKDGIIQLLYFKGEKEVTFGFAFPGTFMCSPQSVYMNQPAVMQIESCRIASSVLRIRRDVFLSLMRESHEFSLWMFDIAMGQFYTSEYRNGAVLHIRMQNDSDQRLSRGTVSQSAKVQAGHCQRDIRQQNGLIPQCHTIMAVQNP